MTRKNGFLHEKKCTTSNIISLHDKNLDRAIEIGITFMYIFEANWSEGFLGPITKQIVTFTWVGRPLKLGTEMVYDPAVIYGRVIELQLRPRSININDILLHELAPFATAMFDTPFETKMTKSKCNLKGTSPG